MHLDLLYIGGSRRKRTVRYPPYWRLLLV